jgi:hypothetical protein
LGHGETILSQSDRHPTEHGREWQGYYQILTIEMGGAEEIGKYLKFGGLGP